MPKTLTIFYATPVIIGLISSLAKEILPEGTVVRNVLDDSILADTKKHGHLTKDITRRLVGYVQHAEAYGSDCLLLTCSSESAALDVARTVVNIPTIKINEPMAEEAVKRGDRVAVLSTVQAALAPTEDLLKQAKASVSVDKVWCEGAAGALGKGDVELSNRLLAEQIERAAATHDVVVLAQASMAIVLPVLSDALKQKVLTSPRLGLERTAQVLRGLEADSRKS